MNPSELVDGSINAGGRWLGRVLHVLRRVLETKLVLQKERAGRACHELHGETREIFCLGLGEIEGEKGFRIALIGFNGEAVILSGRSHN